MEHARALPSHLVERYKGWKSSTFAESRARYEHLADEGQKPPAMVISCCDSRVQVTSVFNAGPGEFFMHRNIANLVPPCTPDGNMHGTSAAIEYAVTALKVEHLIVVGHSSCGGVAGCHAMCSGQAPELEDKSSFVGRWVEILRPGYERVAARKDGTDPIRALEHEAVVVSLENLMTYPFVEEAVAARTLSLHGLWVNIRSGDLLQYMPETGEFGPV
ncbi:MAG: carbonic anhydrase [Boseongicola sp. SB0675_bin_26]|uniref:Carbonic anhydrase n=1 Tax=Boseongicola sp. SB0664_bin_43 TaxID=2604844 RepID=A0A6B0Y323_9RHOB|nr:carbonic anhydrase [Boseongicola sp. SB0664_bin_43]MYH57670.1 carbonic anhydrase [Boseongicola sp. SB0675_bin_26]